ncbi:MAG: hypothetical protein RIT45_3859, partial [Pseudomonadota bacterium]
MKPPDTCALWCVVAPGLERVAETELRALGADAVERQRGALMLEVSPDIALTIAVGSRIVEAVRLEIARFGARDVRALDAGLRASPLAQWLPARGLVRVDVACHKSRLYHSGLVGERVVEAVREAGGRARIGASDDEPAGHLHLRLDHDEALLRVELAAPRAHRRGWRTQVGKASMRETMAAAALLALDWQPTPGG